jgi:hypothetical protein
VDGVNQRREQATYLSSEVISGQEKAKQGGLIYQ